MGVRHLTTFIRDEVPDGCRRVSIIDECKKFHDNNDIRPTLVFDLMGLVNVLLDDKFEMLCGGRHQIYRQIFEDFLGRLSAVADLVFFEDGPLPLEKLGTWLGRQRDRYDRTAKIMDMIDDNVPLSEICKLHESRELPRITTFVDMMEIVAMRFGKLIWTVTKECDAELARYANNNSSVLAVLAEDSDFLIFAGKWQYWSLLNLDKATMETCEYSREALRNYLEVNDQQLSIIATLAGNDVLAFKDVHKFHKRNHIDERTNWKFVWLARYAKKLPRKFSELIHTIAADVVGNNHFSIKDRISDSLAQYNTKFDLPECRDPLQKYCRENFFNFTFKTLCEMPSHMTLHYYDLRFAGFPDLSSIRKESFRKNIGIVLKHRKSKPGGIHYEVYVKETHEEYFKQDYVTPIYPEMELPPLMELLDCDNYPDHDDLRFKLLKWMISDDKLESSDLTVIPENYLFDILVLTFMTTNGFITTNEADLILLSIKHVEENLIPQQIANPNVVDPRAFRVSFLFTMLYCIIIDSMEVVGLLGKTKVMNFDGVYFHILYLKYLDGFDASEELSDIDALRLYN